MGCGLRKELSYSHQVVDSSQSWLTNWHGNTGPLRGTNVENILWRRALAHGSVQHPAVYCITTWLQLKRGLYGQLSQPELSTGKRVKAKTRKLTHTVITSR